MTGIKIMSAYVVVAIAIWMMLLEPAALAASDVSFDIVDATEATYAQLLTDVRNKVKDKNLVYGGRKELPVMAAPSSNYLYVDLKAPEERTITIALNLDKSFNLYVVAYLDKSNNNKKYRSHIFKDFASVEAKRKVFPQAKGATRVIMNYESSYAEVESKAGGRANLGLGIQTLEMFFEKVYGVVVEKKSKNNDKNEARFMLIVMQMLAEATRFAYIENMIVQNFHEDEGYKPDFKTIEFEKSWQKITNGIKDSKKGVISPALDLKDSEDKPWKVSSVDEIAGYMGLLKNEGKTTTSTTDKSLINKLQRYYNRFISFFKPNNGDDDETEAEL